METKDLNSLFEEAKGLEHDTNFQFKKMDTDIKLNHLADAITVMYKINQLGAFEIGKLLTMAKKVCQENDKSFDKWCADKRREKKLPKISRTLMNNYMHVYTRCFGREDIVMEIQLSILYQICMPSFPDTIREFFIKSGLLKNMKYKEFQNLMEKSEKEGLEVFEKEAEKISAEKLEINQCSYTLTKAKNDLKVLESAMMDIARRGSDRNNGMVAFKEQIKTDQPLAYKVNLIIIEAYETIFSTLNIAIVEAEKLLKGNG